MSVIAAFCDKHDNLGPTAPVTITRTGLSYSTTVCVRDAHNEVEVSMQHLVNSRLLGTLAPLLRDFLHYEKLKIARNSRTRYPISHTQ